MDDGLKQLNEDLWHVDAELKLLPIGRRMTVVRLSDGRLVVHSAILGNEMVMADLDNLGQVAFIIVPSAFHRIDAPAYAARYPEAKILCPPVAKKRVSQVVSVNGDYSKLPADSALAWQYLRGVKEGVLIHTNPSDQSTTLIFNDALMNLPDQIPGIGGWIVKLIGSTGGPKVTKTARQWLVTDRAAYAEHLRELAALPNLARAIPAHGAIIETSVPETLNRVADALYRPQGSL